MAVGAKEGECCVSVCGGMVHDAFIRIPPTQRATTNANAMRATLRFRKKEKKSDFQEFPRNFAEEEERRRRRKILVSGLFYQFALVRSLRGIFRAFRTEECVFVQHSHLQYVRRFGTALNTTMSPCSKWKITHQSARSQSSFTVLRDEKR